MNFRSPSKGNLSGKMAPHLCHLLETAPSEVGRQTPPSVRGRDWKEENRVTKRKPQSPSRCGRIQKSRPCNLGSEVGAGMGRGQFAARGKRDESVAIQLLEKRGLLPAPAQLCEHLGSALRTRTRVAHHRDLPAIKTLTLSLGDLILSSRGTRGSCRPQFHRKSGL